MRQAALFGMFFFFGGIGDGFSHVELASSKLKVNLVTIFDYIHQSSTGVKNFACHTQTFLEPLMTFLEPLR